MATVRSKRANLLALVAGQRVRFVDGKAEVDDPAVLAELRKLPGVTVPAVKSAK